VVNTGALLNRLNYSLALAGKKCGERAPTAFAAGPGFLGGRGERA